jgi:hypothetical protein
LGDFVTPGIAAQHGRIRLFFHIIGNFISRNKIFFLHERALQFRI